MNRFGGNRQTPAPFSSVPTLTGKPQTQSNPTFSVADEMAVALNGAAKQMTGMDAFIDRFNGLSEPFYFYYRDGKPTVTLVFDAKEHAYFRQYEDGRLEEQDGVTSTVHIIDKSNMLTPWAAKMVAEKAIRLMPTEPGELGELVTKRMTMPEFTTLMMEAKTAPKDRLEEAGDIGNIAHGCLENSIKAAIAMDNGIVQAVVGIPEDERARNCVDAAVKWMRAHNVRWICTERKIYSLLYKFAGTMDGLCKVDSCSDPLCCRESFKDRLSVADWKSSNQLNIEYLYQTAAYQHAYIEEFLVDITDRWILRLGKHDGEFEPWHLGAADSTDDFDGFLKCLALTRAHYLVKERMSAARKTRTAAKRAAALAEREARKERDRLEKALAKAEEKKKREEEKAAAKVAKKEEQERVKKLKKQPSPCGKKKHTMADVQMKLLPGDISQGVCLKCEADNKAAALPVPCHCPESNVTGSGDVSPNIWIEHVDGCPNKKEQK